MYMTSKPLGSYKQCSCVQ